jgi:hypothetical protein
MALTSSLLVKRQSPSFLIQALGTPQDPVIHTPVSRAEGDTPKNQGLEALECVFLSGPGLVVRGSSKWSPKRRVGPGSWCVLDWFGDHLGDNPKSRALNSDDARASR